MLKDDMERHGQWLFRWRSYLPLVLLPIVVLVFLQSRWMMELLGVRVEEAWDYLCLTIAIGGLLLRAFIVGYVPAGTSGRSTDVQRANALNTTGAYSVVRHPLYFANFIIFIAFAMLLKSLVFILFAAAAFFIYYERIVLAEEDFLQRKYGEQYRLWAERTPSFVPRPSAWVPAALPFSWKTALSREFHGLFLIATVFFISELAEAMVLEHRTFASWFHEEPVWLVFFVFSAAIYMVLVVVCKRTALLRVSGR